MCEVINNSTNNDMAEQGNDINIYVYIYINIDKQTHARYIKQCCDKQTCDCRLGVAHRKNCFEVPAARRELHADGQATTLRAAGDKGL